MDYLEVKRQAEMVSLVLHSTSFVLIGPLTTNRWMDGRMDFSLNEKNNSPILNYTVKEVNAFYTVTFVSEQGGSENLLQMPICHKRH